MKTKSFIPALLFLIFSSTAFAQTEKGNFVLSGNTDLSFLFSNITFGMDSIQTGKAKNNQFGVTDGVGYFVANNLAVGIYGTYSYNYSKIESSNYGSASSQSITESFSILPELQYYFPEQEN